MKKVLIFIAGVIFGAAFYAGGQSLFTKSAPVEQVDSSALKAARDVLAHEKERTAALDKRELDLQLQAAKQDIAQNAPKPDDGSNASADNSAAAGMSNMVKAVVQQQMEMKMAALKARLKLTDEQTAAIQDIMDKQSQIAQDMAGKMLSGKMSRDDMQKAMKDNGASPDDLNKQLEGILTPDQFTAYQGMQNDDKKTAAETQANLEMSQIQSTLQLSDDQKDKVFTALYGQYAQQAGVDGAKPAGDPADITGQMDAKKAALQSVLTPEQFDTYSKYVDSQKKMINAMMGSASAAAGAAPGN